VHLNFVCRNQTSNLYTQKKKFSFLLFDTQSFIYEVVEIIHATFFHFSEIPLHMILIFRPNSTNSVFASLVLLVPYKGKALRALIKNNENKYFIYLKHIIQLLLS
jgi:hypothetical protein